MNEPSGDAARPDPVDRAQAATGRTSSSPELDSLLEQVAQGDQASFSALYRAAAPRVFGVILRMVRDKGEAEDILQDAFMTAWRRADSFDATRGGALTWLVTLARNRAIDRIRQHREVPLGDDESWAELADEAPTPAADAEASQERLRLERCLQQLEAMQRGVVREAFYTGASYNELAERRQVPLGTMKSWIRRSLIQLKSCLER
ncbi:MULTISPECIES: sigma-70 family RNA polymerase sigma factor [unclassified Burkholderia]|uniref:sigma-70 family RNA polymerase sigma factor n=1 Tax=unclassified Burkholderia TaxID=2613784 RepID=UPI0014208E65|nr:MULTISPECIES: sigma-70 family RNA polymerase sigma factor [unclassified Burkholderia]NIE84407.1 sigma-70 family RNA polymerase sigma factor [Burkholderia sp. Tr-860]NIF65843.1 sigma-70 family RNA polymerase sigma factor [Burkholderia sp. Cy-647]NIF95090.1 sigma-70 family RNA polymerase sigma factor [Burkholderia sp. Ax-1720]